jgi:hypothetical protein
MNKRILIILTFFGLLLFQACHSTKEVREVAETKEAAVDSVFHLMQQNQFDYEWFTGKFSASYKQGDKKQNFSGQFRIRKDSVIWLSIYAAMNIEVFRIMITPDSIKMLNRLKKTYFVKNVNFINEQFNTDVDFDILQSLLMGVDFAYYETDKFTLSINENRYKLSTMGRGKLKKYVQTQEDLEKVMVQNMWINPDNYKILKQSIKQVKSPNKKVIATYEDFRPVDNQIFPFSIHFRLVDEKPVLLDLQYKSIIINQKLTFPFKVPRKYKRS